MALAEKGNNLSLDITEQDIAKRTTNAQDSSDSDMYTDWRKEGAPGVRPLFNWAKGVGKKLG